MGGSKGALGGDTHIVIRGAEESPRLPANVEGLLLNWTPDPCRAFVEDRCSFQPDLGRGNVEGSLSTLDIGQPSRRMMAIPDDPFYYIMAVIESSSRCHPYN